MGQQLRRRQQSDCIANLDRIDWLLTNPDWNSCKLNNRIVKNKDTMNTMAAYILKQITS
ncbi:MAG: hypothetical protein MUC48_20685 [Leptolyngbya sp. Prado105]|jgi:hypothetical protein|nr:hypothetical protein [Leptolyngbya sp. Prado105]